jgi:hypothetical protein
MDAHTANGYADLHANRYADIHGYIHPNTNLFGYRATRNIFSYSLSLTEPQYDRTASLS